MKFLEKELEKIIEKEFIDSEEELEFNAGINDNNIEKNLKTEIRKNSLILQNKIDELSKEVQNLNLENENLKKEVFRLKKEEKKIYEALFKILDTYLTLHINGLDNSNTLSLIHKKVRNILSEINIKESANIGKIFDYEYHEAVNEVTEKKEIYIIKNLISQGYLKDNKIFRIAKVIIE